MTPLCVNAAQTISAYCMDHLPETVKDAPALTIQDHPLSYLSTVSKNAVLHIYKYRL